VIWGRYIFSLGLVGGEPGVINFPVICFSNAQIAAQRSPNILDFITKRKVTDQKVSLKTTDFYK
jgi:hypothetical protein